MLTKESKRFYAHQGNLTGSDPSGSVSGRQPAGTDLPNGEVALAAPGWEDQETWYAGDTPHRVPTRQITPVVILQPNSLADPCRRRRLLRNRNGPHGSRGDTDLDSTSTRARKASRVFGRLAILTEQRILEEPTEASEADSGPPKPYTYGPQHAQNGHPQSSWLCGSPDCGLPVRRYITCK